jgi:hypothetical protein
VAATLNRQETSEQITVTVAVPPTLGVTGGLGSPPPLFAPPLGPPPQVREQESTGRSCRNSLRDSH